MRYPLATALLILTVVMVTGCSDQEPDDQGRISVADFLGGDEQGDYAEVLPGYTLRFPEDHGAHEDFRQEWWYFTGNLESTSGRRFGFQLTFFRFNHGAVEDYGDNPWNHGQSWMSHFVLSDIERGGFYPEQDFARGVYGLASADSSPFQVWVNGWNVRQANERCVDCFELVLHAASEGRVLNLRLHTRELPVLHGDNGYSVKDANAGATSYYYSFPRLEVEGDLGIGEESLTVFGKAWMDHEWSSRTLSSAQAGWDWFGLRLSDDTALMVFQVREVSADAFLSATLVDEVGNAIVLPADDIQIEATDWWRSDATGIRYPVEWELGIPSRKLSLRVTAMRNEQEVDLDFLYWEGAVSVEGTKENAPLSGEGYMELTGYE